MLLIISYLHLLNRPFILNKIKGLFFCLLFCFFFVLFLNHSLIVIVVVCGSLASFCLGVFVVSMVTDHP